MTDLLWTRDGHCVNLVAFLPETVHHAHWEVIHERCKASIDGLRLSEGHCIRSGIDDRGPGPPEGRLSPPAQTMLRL